MKPKLQVCTLFLSVYKRTGIKDYFLLSMNLQVCVNIVVVESSKSLAYFRILMPLVTNVCMWDHSDI